MKVKPKYAENIIVLIKRNNNYQWYIANNELWYLDLRKLIKAYQDKGYEILDPDDFSDRFNIDVVNKLNEEAFISHLDYFKVSIGELKDVLINKEYGYIGDLSPSLYIDFDDRKLISFYPEIASYEVFIPDGWEGHYSNSIEIIPLDFQYWLENGINLFKE